MMNKGLLLAGAVAVSLGNLPGSAATVLSSWNFEVNTPGDLSNSLNGPAVVAESGVFTTGFETVGVHTSIATDWSTPAGNGSANSYSVNAWAEGDYFQFSTASTGYEGITLSFDQMGSDTGPKEFKVAYSIDGATFTDLIGGDYVVTNAGWTSSSAGTTSSYSFSFSAITALNNDSSIFFRLINTSNLAISSVNPVASTGTGRIDNVVITAIPEPATALLGVLGLLGLFRRCR